MSVFDILFNHIQKKITLCDEEKDAIKKFFVRKHLKKKEYLLSEGEICRHMAFIGTGLLRTYNIDEKGVEHMALFGWEGWWLSDFSSFLTGVASSTFIDAMEDSELLLISRTDYEKLTLEVPKMDRFFRILYQNSIVTKEHRLRNSINLNAKERYLDFLKSSNQVSNRIPQNLIASFLGIAPETLSRIKRKLANVQIE